MKIRRVAVGRKNWMFAGSDSGGEHAAVLYSLIGTCRLNNVEPEKWLRYVIEQYRSGELILTHFSGEPLAAHTIDHRLTMVDLFCCTGTIAGQVPAAGSEVLSRVNASGREVLTRVLVAGKRSPSPGMAPG